MGQLGRPEDVAYQSSTIGAIDGWKSPVLLIQGDDDRNVAFQQMTGLVNCCASATCITSWSFFPTTCTIAAARRWIYTLSRWTRPWTSPVGEARELTDKLIII